MEPPQKNSNNFHYKMSFSIEEYSHLCCAVFLLFPPPLSLHLFNLPRILRPHCILYIHEPLCSTFRAAQSPGSEVQVWIESRTRLRVFLLGVFLMAESLDQGLLFLAGSPLHSLLLPLGSGIFFLLWQLQAWEWQLPFPLFMTLHFPQNLPVLL